MKRIIKEELTYDDQANNYIKVQDYFGGKYTTHGFVELRIADHTPNLRTLETRAGSHIVLNPYIISDDITVNKFGKHIIDKISFDWLETGRVDVMSINIEQFDWNEQIKIIEENLEIINNKVYSYIYDKIIMDHKKGRIDFDYLGIDLDEILDIVENNHYIYDFPNHETLIEILEEA